MEFNLNINILDKSSHKAIPLDPTVLYDVFIVGGGPAALTAAIYSMRKGLVTGLAAKSIGGQVTATQAVENYLGYNFIEGAELVSKFTDQVKQFEIGFEEGREVVTLEIHPEIKCSLDNGKMIRSKTVILAPGSTWRKLNVPGEEKLTGKGVAYCSTCDAPLFKGKKVLVAGSGNSGVESAIDLAKTADHVTLVIRGNVVKADTVLLEALKSYSNYDILLEHEITEIIGSDKVEGATLLDKKNSSKKEVKTDGLFVEIGMIPNTSFLKNVLDLNAQGEIIIDAECRTGIPGIFAAGDATTTAFKQIIIAAGEGAKAALSAYNFILKKN